LLSVFSKLVLKSLSPISPRLLLPSNRFNLKPNTRPDNLLTHRQDVSAKPFSLPVELLRYVSCAVDLKPKQFHLLIIAIDALQLEGGSPPRQYTSMQSDALQG